RRGGRVHARTAHTSRRAGSVDDRLESELRIHRHGERSDGRTLRMTRTIVERRLTPGYAAAEILKANGVDVVFGLNGDHVLGLYDGLADVGGMTHVTVKHENTAALALAVAGRPGPVHVEITRDVLESDRFESPPPAPPPVPGGDVAPDLDAALARIRSAQRPIIVAGKGAWYAVASQALVVLAEA